MKTYKITSNLEVEVEAKDEFDALVRWENSLVNETVESVMEEALEIKEV